MKRKGAAIRPCPNRTESMKTQMDGLDNGQESLLKELKSQNACKATVTKPKSGIPCAISLDYEGRHESVRAWLIP